MKLTRDIWLAVILWLIVGALAGAVVVALLAWSIGFVILGAVVGVGVAGLIIFRFLNQPLTVSSPVAKVAALVPTSPNLSDEEARAWLDDFLVRQQQTQ